MVKPAEPTHTGTVLIVDDHENVRLLDLLGEQGFSTIVFSRGDEVIETLRESEIQYDVAVVDRALERPGDRTDGDEVIAALKNKYPTRLVICASACYDARGPIKADRNWDLGAGSEGLVDLIHDCINGTN
jgi:CheY-like chemotaxis protein